MRGEVSHLRMRVPFVPEQKEPKISSGALPLKTPFSFGKNQFSLLLMPPSASLGGVPCE